MVGCRLRLKFQFSPQNLPFDFIILFGYNCCNLHLVFLTYFAYLTYCLTHPHRLSFMYLRHHRIIPRFGICSLLVKDNITFEPIQKYFDVVLFLWNRCNWPGGNKK